MSAISSKGHTTQRLDGRISFLRSPRPMQPQALDKRPTMVPVPVAGQPAPAPTTSTTTGLKSPPRRKSADDSQLLLEFTITVLLSFVVLLALLYAVEYYLRLFLTAHPTAPYWAGQLLDTLAGLSPLDVLQVTTGCAGVVFGTMEGVRRLRLARRPRRIRRRMDAELGNAEEADAKGSIGSDVCP
ncbi:hypothetical protein MIND_00926200 [Mycena indigotica]|uniref:Transmembrane protein n=1 Tax=Mycena indigotica TaxID=2126181 RepID=A0A8H6SCL1_9AGAR|nr:uncharacterized protein MIND_00926200 [Mycena indigotica]KAF7296944.1 hypothetical protein MIND_00926200 [Mycena indigotica]